MSSPIDVVKGQITDISPDGYITIRVRYDDWPTLIRRNYKEANVQFIDSRPLSKQQRNLCYALIGDIAAESGNDANDLKEMFKIDFMAQLAQDTADHIFSLANAPMSLINAFLQFLISFILNNNIPTKVPLLNYADDIEEYVYACLLNKKCCVCGKPTELHHVDHVGMGRSRDEIDHAGMRALPLCADHHGEVHLIGQETFEKKYHLCHGIPIDKTLIKIYKLGRKKNV